jgi:hypothetical protein
MALSSSLGSGDPDKKIRRTLPSIVANAQDDSGRMISVRTMAAVSQGFSAQGESAVLVSAVFSSTP